MYVNLLTNIMEDVTWCLSTRNIFDLIPKWHQQGVITYCLPFQMAFICSMSVSVQPLMCYSLLIFDIDCELWCAAQWNSQRSVLSVGIGTFAQMLNFSIQIPVGVGSEHHWCLKITPCTPAIVLDDDNLLVLPCGVCYCGNPIIGLSCFRLEFHIQMT